MCHFDLTAKRCSECRSLADCIDEHQPPLAVPATRTDAPLKVLRKRCARNRRRR